MIGTSAESLRQKFDSEFSTRGIGFASVGITSPAVQILDGCVNWITGITYNVPVSGQLEFSNSGSFFEADTLKFYYLRKPGGGGFRIESQKSGGSWTAEQTVSTDGVLAGMVVTISKSDYRGEWKSRIIGDSGESIIIGA